MPIKSIFVDSLIDGKSEREISELFEQVSSTDTLMTHPADAIKKMWLGNDEEFEEFLIDGNLQRDRIDNRTKQRFISSFKHYIKNFQDFIVLINRANKKNGANEAQWISKLHPALVGKKLNFKEPELFVCVKFDLKEIDNERFKVIVEKFKEKFTTGSFTSFLQHNSENRTIRLTLSKYHLVLNEREGFNDKIALLTATTNSGKDKIDNFENVGSISPLPSINLISKIQSAPITALFASRDLLKIIQEELNEIVLIRSMGTALKEKRFGESGNNIFSLSELYWNGEATDKEKQAIEEYFNGANIAKDEILAKKGSDKKDSSIKNLDNAPAIKKPLKVAKIEEIPTIKEEAKAESIKDDKKEDSKIEKKIHGEISSEKQTYDTIVTAMHHLINDVTPEKIHEGVTLFFNGMETNNSIDSGFTRIQERYSANPILLDAVKKAITQNILKVSEYKNNLSLANNENSHLKAQIEGHIDTSSKLEKEKGKLLEELETTNAKIQKERQGYEEKISQISQQFEKVKDGYLKAKEVNELLENKIKILQNEHKDESKNFHDTLDTLKENNALLKEKIVNLEKSYNKEINGYKSQIDQLVKKETAQNSTVSTRSSLKEANMKKKQEIKELKGKTNSKKEEVKELKTQEALLKEEHNIKKKIAPVQQIKLPKNVKMSIVEEDGDLFTLTGSTESMLGSSNTNKPLATVEMIESLNDSNLSSTQKETLTLLKQGYAKDIDFSLPEVQKAYDNGLILDENGYYTFKNLEDSLSLKSAIYFNLKEKESLLKDNTSSKKQS